MPQISEKTQVVLLYMMGPLAESALSPIFVERIPESVEIDPERSDTPEFVIERFVKRVEISPFAVVISVITDETVPERVERYDTVFARFPEKFERFPERVARLFPIEKILPERKAMFV